MKKIIYIFFSFFIFCILGLSQSYATLDVGTYNIGTMQVVLSIVNTNDLNVAVSVSGVFKYNSIISGGKNTVLSMLLSPNEPRLLYVHNTGGGLVYRNYNLTNGLGSGYNILATSSQPGYVGRQVVCNTSTCYGIDPALSSSFGYTRTLGNTTVLGSLDDTIVFGSSSNFSAEICFNQNVPGDKYDNYSYVSGDTVLSISNGTQTGVFHYLKDTFDFTYSLSSASNITNFNTGTLNYFPTSTGSFSFKSFIFPLQTQASLQITTGYPKAYFNYLSLVGEGNDFQVADCNDPSDLYFNGEFQTYGDFLEFPEYIDNVCIYFKKSIFTSNTITHTLFGDKHFATIDQYVCENEQTGAWSINGLTQSGSIEELFDPDYHYTPIDTITEEEVLAESLSGAITSIFENQFSVDSLNTSSGATILGNAFSSGASFTGTLGTYSSSLIVLDPTKKTCEVFNSDGSFKFYSNGSFYIHLNIMTGTFFDKILIFPQTLINLVLSPFNNALSLIRTIFVVPNGTNVCFLGYIYEVQYQRYLPISGATTNKFYAGLGDYAIYRGERTFLDYFVLLVFGMTFFFIGVSILKPKS